MPGKGIDPHGDSLARVQLRVVAGGQGKVYFELRQVLQGGNPVAGIEIAAQFRVDDAHRAGKRRLDALLIEPRLCLGQLRRGLLEVRPGAIILALGNGFLPYQFLVALVQQPRQLQAGNLVLAAGPLHPVVEGNEQVARGHPVPGADFHRGHLATRFGTELHPAHCPHGAYRRQHGIPLGQLGGGRGDGDRAGAEIHAGQDCSLAEQVGGDPAKNRQ